MRHASIRFIGFAVSVPVRPAAERKRGLSGHHRSQPPLLRVEVVFQVMMCWHLVALGLYREHAAAAGAILFVRSPPRCRAPHRLRCFSNAGRWRWRYISCVASPELPVRFGAICDGPRSGRPDRNAPIPAVRATTIEPLDSTQSRPAASALRMSHVAPIRPLPGRTRTAWWAGRPFVPAP
jgi:hypothetical protein